jgi:protein dithiol oxidoreductase (disulfide-forming)
LAATSSGVAVFSAQAATGSSPTEGKQYAKMDPPVTPPLPAGKIEVLEFFSYACPHCNDFEPYVEAWSKKLPADVVFQRVPVPFLFNAENFTRTYYALETLGQVSALQRKVFDAVHVEHLRLDKPADIAAVVAKGGLDSTKFLEAFNSFSVANSVNRAKKLANAHKLDGVPSMAVQGRYATSPGQAGGPSEALAVVDYLVQRTRKA